MNNEGSHVDKNALHDDVINARTQGHPENLRITHEALAELQESDAFIQSFSLESGYTTESIYGPDGALRSLWNQSWNSAGDMRSDLCQNMGGGVPIVIIEELVRICSEEN